MSTKSGAIQFAPNGPATAPWARYTVQDGITAGYEYIRAGYQEAGDSIAPINLHTPAYVGYSPLCATDGEHRHAVAAARSTTAYLYGPGSGFTTISGYGSESGVVVRSPLRTIALPGLPSSLAVDDYSAYILYARAADGVLCVARYPLTPAGGLSMPPERAADATIADTSGEALGLATGVVAGALYVSSGAVWVLAYAAAGARLYRGDFAAGALEYITTIASLNNLPPYGSRMYCDGRLLTVSMQDGLYVGTLAPADAQTTTVGGAIRALCLRADIPELDLDTADLNAVPLAGYGVARRGAARGAIESLTAYTPMAAMESNGRLVFKRRQATDAVTEIGEDELLDMVEVQRMQDKDLPAELTLAYLSTDADYQPGAQSRARLTGVATAQTSVQIAAAMSDQAAAEIVARMLAEAYAMRESYKFGTTYDHAGLEPGDVVRVTSGGRAYLARITSREEGQGELHFEAKAENPLMYEQYAVAQPISYTPQQVSYAGSSTLLQLSGIPPLRDADRDLGIYIAYQGAGGGWRGARLQEGGQDVSGTASAYRAKTGTLQGPLSVFALGSAVPDFVNSVDIQFDTSIPVDFGNVTLQDVYAGRQVLVIGDEVVGVMRAALIGDGLYRCSGLLRGMRGSEVQAHAAGAQAVVVAAGAVVGYTYEPSAIGSAVTVRAVSAGQDPALASDVRLQRTAGTSRLLSPVAIRAGRHADGVIEIQWHRRSRYDQAIRSNGEADVDAVAEAYEVEIVVGATVVRTLTCSTPSVLYPLAQQVSDTGARATSISVRVYQISTTSGRGRPGSATLSIPA